MGRTAPSQNDNLAYSAPWWNRSNNVVSRSHCCIQLTARQSSDFPIPTFLSCARASCSTDTIPCHPPSQLLTSNQSSHSRAQLSSSEAFPEEEPSATTEHSLPSDRHGSRYCRSAMPTAIADGSLIAHRS